MRKLNVLVIISSIVLCGLHSHAQNLEDLPSLKEIKGKKLLEKIEPKLNEKNGLWGYANQEGKFSVKPVFSEAHPYEGKVARVRIGDKWGAINEKGLIRIIPRFDSIDPFSDDSLAVCSVNGRYGLINPNGYVIVKLAYTSFVYADYGYVVCENGMYGTRDHKGEVLLQPQFESIEIFDRDNGLSHIKKGGKWGVMRDGKEVLVVKWDKPLTLLKRGTGDQPDLYLASQNRRVGVVTQFGDYVVPPIYDKIEMSSSGNYYITESDGKYGAISLKMDDIVPPIMDSKPFLGENLFRVHDDGQFYCANMHGSVDFAVSADLYEMFKPEEYAVTKYFPQWAKTHIIEESNEKRRVRMEEATVVCDLLSRYGFDVTAASMDSEMPKGFQLSLPDGSVDKYGLLKRGVFKRSVGGSIFKAYEDSENGMSLEYASDRNEYVVRMDGYMFSINEAVGKFNIREFTGFYPREYAIVNEEQIMVSFGFVMSGDASAGLMETDSYMLPVRQFPINPYMGKPNSSKECTAVITFSLDSLKAVSCVELHKAGANMLFSDFGGFYTYNGEDKLASQSSAICKYDRYGRLDWEYIPRSDESYYDIEETENYIYLCGSFNDGGVEKPVLRQLSKRGHPVNCKYGTVMNSRYTGVVCNNGILYMKSVFVKGAPDFGKDYYPTYSLDTMNDNAGVWYKCVWEDWGSGIIGGFALADRDGTWLSAPSMSEQMSTSYDWEYGAFSHDKDFLIIRHHGLYGLVDKNGNMLIDPKYESLEPLENPKYFRVRVGGYYGVVDINDRVVVPLEYSSVGNMSEDVIVVSKNKMYGCFDKDGKLSVPLEYEEIREFVGGMARIRFKNRFGFIDKKGEMVVAPFSDEVENFSEGLTLVTIKGKMGFVSLAGDWIAPPMYDSGRNFSAGLAPLAMNGNFGYIDKSGNFAIQMQFSDALEFDAASGLACVAKNGKWGLVNTSGEIVIPTQFDKVEICSDGYVYVESNGKCGIYSQRGTVVYPPECDSIEHLKNNRLFRHGVANARLKGVRVRIDKNGNVIHKYSMLKK